MRNHDVEDYSPHTWRRTPFLTSQIRNSNAKAECRGPRSRCLRSRTTLHTSAEPANNPMIHDKHN